MWIRPGSRDTWTPRTPSNRPAKPPRLAFPQPQDTEGPVSPPPPSVPIFLRHRHQQPGHHHQVHHQPSGPLTPDALIFFSTLLIPSLSCALACLPLVQTSINPVNQSSQATCLSQEASQPAPSASEALPPLRFSRTDDSNSPGVDGSGASVFLLVKPVQVPVLLVGACLVGSPHSSALRSIKSFWQTSNKTSRTAAADPHVQPSRRTFFFPSLRLSSCQSHARLARSSDRSVQGFESRNLPAVHPTNHPSPHPPSPLPPPSRLRSPLRESTSAHSPAFSTSLYDFSTLVVLLRHFVWIFVIVESSTRCRLESRPQHSPRL